MKRYSYIIIAVITLLSCAQKKESDIVEQIKPTGYVNDFAGVISEQDEVKIKTLINALENSTSAQIAVVTVKSLSLI